ncbi:MAG: hypothetical protein F4Y03_05470 [Alphaproteobacteria bacterium]|nr:hypothetical protein [Alphaproteobacteria bacterium]
MTRETSRANELRYVLFEEEGAWVAICLEHYIGSQGQTREEAERGLKCAYRAELDHSMENSGVPFQGIMRAPDRFFELWNSNRADIVCGTIYDRHGVPEQALAA